jgi:Spy/CpxP family protein refolding chaperone
MNPQTRSRQTALAFLLGAALVGGVLGFSADRIVSKDRFCRWGDQVGMRRLFGDELNLTPAQRVAVDSILDEKHRDIAEVVKPVKPQLDSIGDHAMDHIAQLLTPTQRATFEEMRRTSQQQPK